MRGLRRRHHGALRPHLRPLGPGRDCSRYLFQGPGLGNLVAYVGIAILGCAGYGAVFLLVGLFFRNPMVAGGAHLGVGGDQLPPAAAAQEGERHLLPAVALPGAAARGLLDVVVAEPISPWISVPGLLIFTALVLAFAGWRARRMEISYGGD